MSFTPIKALFGFLLFLAPTFSFAQISGYVFRDYNGNGQKDNSGSFNEPFLADVTVKAYDASGAEVASVSTSALGAYSFSSLMLPLRIEFSGLAVGDYPSAMGGSNLTNVQFYSVSSSTANFGVNYPGDYCHTEDPRTVTTCFVNGNTEGTAPGEAGALDVIVSYPYSANGTSPTVYHDALGSAVGAVWGVAYNRNTRKAFVGAVVRRHMGLGPLGLGGVYVLDYSGGGAPVISNFLNLDGLSGIDVGSVLSNSGRGLANNAQTPNHDATVFDKVGKEGLGDLDISDDGNTLYVVNLFEKKIISINLTAYNATGAVPTAATTIALPAVTCNNGQARPWALKYYKGSLYAGITCTAEGAGGTFNDLTSFVYRYNGSSWTQVLQIPLTYNRWYANNIPAAGGQLRPNKPWVDAYSDFNIYSAPPVERIDEAQLILSDIEFDIDGSMIIGYVDRSGLQIGIYNYNTNTAGTQLEECFANGDILRASYDGTSYTLESGGTVGGLTGPGTNTSYNWPYSGPGGGEFYAQEMWGLPTGGHSETSYGALALLPGKGEVTLCSMDPLNYSSGGIKWLSNTNGTQNRGIQLYDATSPTYYGKSVGLGDVELLCQAQPIELTIRVWLDTQENSIQDAGENPIDGVCFEIFADFDSNGVADGPALGTTSSNLNGQVIFNQVNVADGDPVKAGTQPGPQADKNYLIRVCAANWTSGAGLGALSGLSLVSPDMDATLNGDMRDSDGSLVGGVPQLALKTGLPGENQQSVDLGFKAGCVLPSSIALTVTAPDCTAGVPNNNGKITLDNISGADKYGITVGSAYSAPLYASATAIGTLSQDLQMNITNAGETYTIRFFNLADDCYVDTTIVVAPVTCPCLDTVYNLCPGDVYTMTAQTTLPTVQWQVNHLDGNGWVDIPGANSLSYMVSDTGSYRFTGLSSQGCVNESCCPLVFKALNCVEYVALGNLVFMDVDGNDVYNAGTDMGIDQVVVQLFLAGSDPVVDPSFRTTVTTNGGYYLFDSLLVGQYFVYIPSSQFASGGALFGKTSVSPEGGDTATDDNADENGMNALVGGGISSGIIDLTANTEPVGEMGAGTYPGALDDNNVNMTVDFGFKAPPPCPPIICLPVRIVRN